MLKHALLGLLAQEARHGYDLKQDFEALLGGTWPVNIGQVYSTLSRLERDGLVENDVVAQDLLPDRKVYAITLAGEEALNTWIQQPARGMIRLKDEFTIKLLVTQLVAPEEALPLIWKQRQVYMRTLAQLTALRNDETMDKTTVLLVRGAILHVEADLDWLAECEEQFKEQEG